MLTVNLVKKKTYRKKTIVLTTPKKQKRSKTYFKGGSVWTHMWIVNNCKGDGKSK